MTTIVVLEAEAVATCGCGQDLETWRREHCPRCGREIPQRSFTYCSLGVLAR
jgi:predicted amidophosphoribosyltransferase